jgi:hypothetical protein
VPARVCAAHVQRQDTDCAGAAAGGRGVRAQVACSHLLARHARQSVLLLHTLHQLFFLAICFFSTPHFAPTFFCPPCAVQACMLSCICTYTCIFFFVYIVYYFFVYSFFLPPMRCASMYAIMYMYTYMYILTYIHTHTFIYRSCYSTPCIDLASHGFIVFAVHTHTHTYTHAHTTRRRWHQSMYVYVCTLYVSSMYVCILCI